MNRIIKIGILVFLALQVSFPLFSQEPGEDASGEITIESVRLIGKSAKINFRDIENRKGKFSEEEIKALAAHITKKYHDRGYVAAYIKKLVITKEGILEIYIHETLVAGISVTGVRKAAANREIEKILVPEPGEIFNEFIWKKRKDIIKKEFRLDEIRVEHQENENGDLLFSVTVTEKSPGEFYGLVGMDSFYGIMPRVGYLHLFDSSAIDVSALLGIRDSGISRAEGDVSYYLLRKTFLLRF